MKTISYFIGVFSILLIIIAFTQCNNRKKSVMSEYIESNINYCMTPIIENRVDSVQAKVFVDAHLSSP